VTAPHQAPDLIAEFEFDENSLDVEEIDILASVLAELLRDTESRLKQGKG
jgi:hypothetical protein